MERLLQLAASKSYLASNSEYIKLFSFFCFRFHEHFAILPMALSLSCLCWSEKHETEDWHWLAWMYNCKHSELHRMPQVPSPVSWHDMTVMWHDHAVMVTSHDTSTLATRSGSWYLIVCIKLNRPMSLVSVKWWSWYQHWAIVSRGEQCGAVCHKSSESESRYPDSGLSWQSFKSTFWYWNTDLLSDKDTVFQEIFALPLLCAKLLKWNCQDWVRQQQRSSDWSQVR